ncbi:MAG: permease-like cell division protein FtsX [Bacteroidales bacterium]
MSKQPQPTRGKFRNARLTSTISISLVLFVLGLIAFMGVFANQLSVFVKENIGFTVVLKDDVTPAEISKFQKVIGQSPYAKTYQYISKADALEELTKELGENPEEFLGFNPLSASLEVKLHAPYANNDSIAKIEQSIRGLSKNIREFNYRKDIVELVNNNMQKMSIALLALAAILLAISFTLINNTVRLGIYSKRFLIHTMKLVGATPGFIRRPFVVANVASGIMASIIAMALITGLLYLIGTEYAGFYKLISLELLLIVFGIILGLGIVITALASFFATNRYIRMRSDDMYLV